LTPTELLEHVIDDCSSLLEASTLTSDQIQKRSPLFSATVVLLPNDYAVYSMKMSHTLGDGVTYFMLLKQLSLLMSGLPEEEVQSIDWNHPKKATHELYPSQFSHRDIELMYGAPFLMGAAKNVLTSEFQQHQEEDGRGLRQAQVLLLEKSKVNDKKRELRNTLDCSEISSNT
jgi:hypothetical protein